MTLKLKAENRDVFGKKLGLSRKEGKMPAVVYSDKKESLSVFVPLKDFKKTWKEAGESTIIELVREETKTPLNVIINVIIKEVAIDPVSDEPTHADFYRVEMDKSIEAMVPIEFEGVSPAVKELGGVLVKVMYELEVQALPKDLPPEIKIDISVLKNLNDKITVADIKLPSGVKLTAKEDEVIVLVEEQKAEEEVKEMKLEDIEVEKKGKKPEEAEETSNA